MLKYFLSTFCIFLFFEGVRLKNYKCASPDCSARVKVVYPGKNEREISVRKGEYVDIHGVDSGKENFLVKVKADNDFHLLPMSILREDVNVSRKAILDIEDPFQQKQSRYVKTSTNQEKSSKIERFNWTIKNISYPFSEMKGSRDLVDQSASSKNGEETKPSISAARLKEQEQETPAYNSESSGNVGADKSKILENNTTSEDNRPDSLNSEVNTLNGTKKDDSKSTQFDSTAADRNQTDINETEESDDVSVKVVVQENESQVTENGFEVKYNFSDLPTSDYNSSNRPSQNSILDKLKTGPKVSLGDDPGTFSTNTAPLTNHADENRTLAVGNESLIMNPSDNTSLNETGTSVNQSNLSIGTQQYAINSKKDEENETIVFKLDNSTLKQNYTVEKEQGIAEAETKPLKGSAPSASNASTPPVLPVNEPEFTDRSVSEEKSGPSYNNASLDSDAADSTEKKGSAERMRFNPGDELKNTSSSPVKNEDIPSQETMQSSTSDSNSSSSSTDKPLEFIDHKFSVGSGSSDSNKSGGMKPASETAHPTVPPDTNTLSSSTNNPHISDDHKHSGSSAPTGESGSSNENVSSDSNKSDEVKPTAPPDSTAGEPVKSDDHLPPVNPTPTGKPELSNKTELSDSDINVPAKNEYMIPGIPIVDSSKVKEKLESNSLNNQVGSSAKPSDSSQENENEVTPSSQFLDALPKNANDLSADQVNDGLEDSKQSSEKVTNLAVLQSYLNFEWLQKQNDSVEQPHCDEESCAAFSIFDSMAKYGFDLSAINLQSWSLAELHQSKQTSLVAGILLCTVLLFTTLVSILRNSKRKSRINTLISVVNQLEKKLLVATKEISLLEEQLTDAPVALISQPATEADYECSELLQQQIELLQVRNTDLEDKVSYLEKELNNVTTSAFEMHKLLENSLSTQAQSRLAEDELDTLRALTERQDRQIDDLMKEMDTIFAENRYFKEDLKKMEKEFSSQTKKNLELSEKNRSLSLRLDQQIEETATMKNNYKSEIYQLQAKIEDLEINLRRSEFQVESLNRAFMDKHENKSDDQMQALQDDVQLKLQLSTLKAMNNELSAELKEQRNARRTLDDHIGDVIKKCNELTQDLEVSEKGRSEAVNKLQVLTDYFNEKESQLQKEIAAKEKLFMESENKDQLLSQKLSSLKEEIKNNKDRNEELKKEIEAQERSFKTQLAAAEQKSRDLWFALRQAERKYQESEKEAATLRNKILILENNLSSANQKLNEKHSTNGDINGQSTIFSAEMLSFRGSNDFIPPPPSPVASHSPEIFPPEPSYSPDERLPPLGGRRVPSPPSFFVPPPEDDDFKPPLPHAQFMPGRSRHDSHNMSSYYGDNPQYN